MYTLQDIDKLPAVISAHLKDDPKAWETVLKSVRFEFPEPLDILEELLGCYFLGVPKKLCRTIGVTRFLLMPTEKLPKTPRIAWKQVIVRWRLAINK